MPPPANLGWSIESGLRVMPPMPSHRPESRIQQQLARTSSKRSISDSSLKKCTAARSHPCRTVVDIFCAHSRLCKSCEFTFGQVKETIPDQLVWLRGLMIVQPSD